VFVSTTVNTNWAIKPIEKTMREKAELFKDEQFTTRMKMT